MTNSENLESAITTKQELFRNTFRYFAEENTLLLTILLGVFLLALYFKRLNV